MKASELRIGNWVEQIEHKNSDNPSKKQIKFDESNWYRIGECIEFLEDFEPIPLTEDWLVKFGFIKKSEWEFESPCTVFYIERSSIGDFEFCKKPQYDEYGWLSTIKHVHQLQNLYYALTGEELQIK